MKLLAADGPFELGPLRVVAVDVAALGAAVTSLGLALLPGGDEGVGDVLRALPIRPTGPRIWSPTSPGSTACSTWLTTTDRLLVTASSYNRKL